MAAIMPGVRDGEGRERGEDQEGCVGGMGVCEEKSGRCMCVCVCVCVCEIERRGERRRERSVCVWRRRCVEAYVCM